MKRTFGFYWNEFKIGVLPILLLVLVLGVLVGAVVKIAAQ